MENHHITFLRHGESVGNREDIIQGVVETSLSEDGIRQVTELAERWQQEGRQIDVILTSPCLRALETAEIISAKLGGEITENALWRGRDRGKFSGVSWKDMRADGNRLDLAPRHMQPGETGESTAQFSTRAGYALQGLMKQPPGHYLVISHGGFLNFVMHMIHNIKKVSEEQGVHFVVDNSGYAEFEYRAERNQWVMLGLTQPDHRLPIFSQYNDLYRFIFMRHGQSVGNTKRMFQGQFETPLTEIGREQAVEAGKKLKEMSYQFDAIYASPMERALETAELINEHYGVPLTSDQRLKEVHNGILAGMTIDRILELYPDDKRPDHDNPYIPIGETGESQLELYLRAGEMLDDLLKNPPGEYLVVAHGALLNNIVLNILGSMPVPRSRPTWLMFSNTSFAEFGYSIQENLWRLLGFLAYEGH